MSSNPTIANSIKRQLATLGDVVSTLRPGLVLIEVVKIQDYDWQQDQWAGTDRYLAFVVHPDQPTQLVDLGDAKELDRLVTDWLSTLRRGHWKDTLVTQHLAVNKLYSRLWVPLKTAIGEARDCRSQS